MKYYKQTDGEYIIVVGKNIGGTEITEAEYNNVLSELQNRPRETETVGYRLKEDLTWESYEKEPQPEPDLEPEEIVDIIFGGAV